MDGSTDDTLANALLMFLPKGHYLLLQGNPLVNRLRHFDSTSALEFCERTSIVDQENNDLSNRLSVESLQRHVHCGKAHKLIK